MRHHNNTKWDDFASPDYNKIEFDSHNFQKDSEQVKNMTEVFPKSYESVELDDKQFKTYKDIARMLGKAIDSESMRIKQPNKFHHHMHCNDDMRHMHIDIESRSNMNWDRPYKYFTESQPGIPDFIIDKLEKRFGLDWPMSTIYDFAETECVFGMKDARGRVIDLLDQPVTIRCRKHGIFKTTFREFFNAEHACPACREVKDLDALMHVLGHLAHNIAQQEIDRIELSSNNSLDLSSQKKLLDSARRHLCLEDLQVIVDRAKKNLLVERYEGMPMPHVSELKRTEEVAYINPAPRIEKKDPSPKEDYGWTK